MATLLMVEDLRAGGLEPPETLGLVTTLRVAEMPPLAALSVQAAPPVCALECLVALVSTLWAKDVLSPAGQQALGRALAHLHKAVQAEDAAIGARH